MFTTIWQFIINVNLFWQDLESESSKAFQEAASGIDDIPFGLTSTAEVFGEHKVESDGVVLFKKVNIITVD